MSRFITIFTYLRNYGLLHLVNITNNYGYTLLDEAIDEEDIEGIRFLLNTNLFDLQKIHRNGMTAIEYVFHNNNREILLLFLNYLRRRCHIYKLELVQKAFHPSRIQRLLNQGIDLEDLEDYL